MLRKLILITFIFFAFIFNTGCSNKEVETKGGLKIYSWNSGLGSINESDLNKQRFSYDINLTNENQKDVYVKSIKPSVNDTIKDRILNKDLIVNVNKNLKSNDTISIKGEIIIDTKGLSKSEILNFEPFIIDIKVSTDEIIDLKKEIK